MNENRALIELFKGYIGNNESGFKVCERALKKGIIINDNCASDIIDYAINVWGVDGFLLNQTFHKSLKEVSTSSLEKLIIQQAIHYYSVYLSDIFNTSDVIYIPSEKLDVPNLSGKYKFIKISSLSISQVKQKLWDLCKSGIAFSKETLNNLEILSKYMDIDMNNIEEIKNIEFKSIMYDKLSIVPENPISFLRLMVYSLTKKSLLIKDRDTISSLSMCNKTKAFILIKRYKDSFGLEGLASIFNRFKPLFLALKQSEPDYLIDFDEIENNTMDDINKLNSLINKISHLSKKYHKPFVPSDLDNFSKWCLENDNKKDFKKVLISKLEKAGVWRAIRLLNYLNDINIQKAYKIRNGKVWICEKENNVYFSKKAKKIIDNFIIDVLKKNINSKKVYLDDNVAIALPQSEKMFCGNIPFSSSISFDKDDIIIGIHWFNTDERIDLDLKVISNDYTIGWNADYRKGDKILFSGDVTNAPKPNGASEYIFIDKSVSKTLLSLKVNNFTNYCNAECEFIIAKSKRENIDKNYVIDPSDIILKIPSISFERGKAEHSLGMIIIDDKMTFVFTNLSTSDRSVSFNSNVEDILRKCILFDSKSKAMLKDYLKKSGAIFVNDPSEADFDFSISNLDKASLISLFNK